jgi:hypothetical protein
MQYVIRLRAQDGITDHLDPDALCFILDYTELEIETMLSFTGTSSGMTRINPDATMSVCTSQVSLNEAENTAYLIYDDVGGTLPVIEFQRAANNLPFTAEIFTIVVDVYPGDQFQLTCPFFRYADGDNITCYIPNSFTPPAPEFIAPFPYELTLDNDNNVMFMTGDPVLNMDNSGVTIPLRMRSNYTFPAAPLSIPYLDYYFTVESTAPIPPPVPQGASGYEVDISPATGLHTLYTIKVRRTGSALSFSSGGGIFTMFDLYIERPNPQNLESTIDLTYLSGRFEAQFQTIPPGAVFCKRMIKGGTGDRTVEFTGNEECANANLLLAVSAVPGSTPSSCGDLFVNVSLGILNNSPVRELRFVLDFDMTNGAFIDEANIQNGLPCNVTNNLSACTDRVGTVECYEVDGNTLTYCFSAASGNEITYSGGVLQIPVTAESGCITNITVRELAYYIVGQGTVTCVPNTNLTGFPICSQEISGIIKSGPENSAGCWIEEVDVKIVATDNLCAEHIETTVCSAPYAFCVCDEGNYTITPEKNDNPLNGVTSFDLVLISKHILGLEPLDSPYKMIAADANKSGSITTFDIVEFRKLILGIHMNGLPNNTSWRFVPRELVFVNPSNPFSHPFPVVINAELDNTGLEYSFAYNSMTEYPTAADFVAIKVGDMNCTAVNCQNDDCASCGTPQRPANPSEHFTMGLPGMAAKAGEAIVLPVYALGEQPLIAFQSGLRFDPTRFEFMGVSAGDVPGFTPDCLNLSEVSDGKIKVLWLSFDHEENYLQPGQAMFYVALRALKNVRGNEPVLTTDDAVFANLGYTSDKLEIPLSSSLIPTIGHRDFSASEVLSVSCSPNPSSGAVELSLLAKAPAAARVSVFGPYGVRVFYRELQLGKGNNNLPVQEAASWPTGIYTWHVQIGKENLSGRFVRQ